MNDGRFKADERRSFIKRCEKCEKSYSANSGIQRTCDDCRSCKQCGVRLLRHSRQFCSNPCKMKWRHANDRAFQSRLIEASHTEQSNLRRGLAMAGLPRPSMRGPRNHRFTGASPEGTARGRVEYKTWRRMILARDNGYCQRCGYRSKRPHVHHKVKWEEAPELRYSLENGITLCCSCHKKLHLELRSNS